MNNDLSIQYIPTDRVVPYARNARTHSRDQIKQVANSITKFGYINPVIMDEKKMIIAGHARVLAAREIGLDRIPVIRVDHLTEAEKRAYILADNRIAENAGWDQDLLRIELEFLARVHIDVDVELTGFSTPDIDIILNPPDEDDMEEAPPPPPDAENTITRTGDLWQLGPHRLICGDVRDPSVVTSVMDGKSARMVITDPPYNVAINGHVCGQGQIKHEEFTMASGEMSMDEFVDFLVASLFLLAQASMDGSLHYIFMDWRHMQELMAAGNRVYYVLVNLCVWAKTNGGMGSFYRSQHELVFVYRKGVKSHINNVELGKHGRYRTNVWSYPGVNTFGEGRDEALAMHPTVKPVRLVMDAILDASKRGDIILDGFLGSGTTLIAAERTGRICYGIEIDPRYVDVALLRWMKAGGQAPVHLNSGKTFDELASGRAGKTACEA
jgi:DNA modification methylase